MAANVLTAMEFFNSRKNNSLPKGGDYKISINSAGSAFEVFVKDALSGSFYNDPQEREMAYSRDFSWLGNQNHPPDAIARGGDAYEIKKHEGSGGMVALNSSPPKDMLYPSDPRITEGCRKAMGSTPLDLFYVVGKVSGGSVRSVFFVQGKLYAASPDVYSKIYDPLAMSVGNAIRAAGLESGATKELGRVARADPLGRASLRVRGMWQIISPAAAFSNIAPSGGSKEFQAYALLLHGKIGGLGEIPNGVNSREVGVPDPNNPAIMLKADLLEVSW